MTYDPIAGAVQIPSIKRTAIGSVKAINACRIAMLEQDEHRMFARSSSQKHVRDGKRHAYRYKETPKEPFP
jgi:L-serine dehydratase